jgi:hypothetical protein
MRFTRGFTGSASAPLRAVAGACGVIRGTPARVGQDAVRFDDEAGLPRRAFRVIAVVVWVVTQQEDALSAVDNLDAGLRVHL